MRILGIETSCDETSAAVVEDGTVVCSNFIASSKDAFRKLAGVIPEEAARKQIECSIPAVEQALVQAGVTFSDIDAIAVTRGPGLLGSLLVGTTTAQLLASIWHKPLIGVHHTLGHLTSTWIHPINEQTLQLRSGQANKPFGFAQDKRTNEKTCPQFPLLTLSVSGGHTDLWLRESHLKGRLLGRTRDDAAGEAFDKGASMLGLPYPGGPSVAKAAVNGNPQAYAFPRPLHGDDAPDFSFSGLKTSLKYLLRDLKFDAQSPDERLADIAASYEQAICLHLLDRLRMVLQRFPHAKEVHVVGGVSANQRLRSLLQELLTREFPSVIFRAPSTLAYCTDNAAMIAAAGYFLWQERGDAALEAFTTEACIPLEGILEY